MAYIVFKNKKTLTISAEQGAHIWESLLNPVDLDDKQLDFLSTVSKIYLNYYTAPQSYLDAHADLLHKMYGHQPPVERWYQK